MKVTMASLSDVYAYTNHLITHLKESGENDIIYGPVSRTFQFNKDEFIKRFQDNWKKSLDETEWERAWVLEDRGRIVGHLDLRGGALPSSLHRCTVGMGLDREYRGQGLGKKLLTTAIDWAQSCSRLDWMDLNVFSHNIPARKLYENCRFKMVHELPDMFRVDDVSITDIFMTLKLK